MQETIRKLRKGSLEKTSLLEWNKTRTEVKTNNKVLTEIYRDTHVEKYKSEPSQMDYMVRNNMVNNIVFGQEAWRWKQSHPSEAALGLNQRDCADTITLKLLDTIEKDAAMLTAMKFPEHEIRAKLIQKASMFKQLLTPYYEKQERA